MAELNLNDINRFMDKISPEPNSGCWLWAAGCDPKGYGYFWLNDKMKSAHRLSYILHRGEVPEGLELDHLCRVRCCVNPWHLEPVTHLINCQRGIGGINGSRMAATLKRQRTHCNKGHEYTPENIYVYRNTRRCRACIRLLWTTSPHV